jgi:hypothetical protein
VCLGGVSEMAGDNRHSYNENPTSKTFEAFEVVRYPAYRDSGQYKKIAS